MALEIEIENEVTGDLIPAAVLELHPLVTMAMSTDIDPVKLDKMLDVQQRWEANEARKAYNRSMTKAKAEFKPAKKSGYNKKLQNRYPKLEDMDEAVRDPLSNHGLSYRFVPSNKEVGVISIKCVISHELGHSEDGSLSFDARSNMNKAVNPLQSMRSVRTYLKGMLLSDMLGIVSDSDHEGDDDGDSGGAEDDYNQDPPKNRYPKFNQPEDQPDDVSQTINPSQAKVITNIIENNDLDEDAWLAYFEKHFESRNIADIPKQMFQRVMGNLTKAVNAKKRGGSA